MFPDINHIELDRLGKKNGSEIPLSVLRTDLIHPVISGNKWFKLRFYLDEAVKKGYKTIGSFGGAYSNHIMALAAAAKMSGLASIGIIRGEADDSPTLQEARELGMKIKAVSRESFKDREEIIQSFPKQNEIYWVEEGGYGMQGARGAATILSAMDCSGFTHILCACGTGTMAAGLIMGAADHQKIIGISVLKNNTALEKSIAGLLPDALHRKIHCIHDYHFGGYAKHPVQLLDYMNDFYQRTHIPSDIVYTSKLFYAAEDLIQKGYFEETANILLIHSGGLQGNRSLSKNTLCF
ncbi:1-aminocyclopropane-1-carboxylate deaminase/D-cysteine desulfhydrase [Sediminibacterium sp.]|uniref:1-aminocyclopropane-1-carboxylate deaminase/D-cysteine desulfhydrase n=1 Tax=Sediminibacterium sp. TaxID=1917865 RepID=UPI003F6A52FA